MVVTGGGLRNKSEAQSMQEYAMLISNRTLPSNRHESSLSTILKRGPALSSFCLISGAGFLHAFCMQPETLRAFLPVFKMTCLRVCTGGY